MELRTAFLLIAVVICATTVNGKVFRKCDLAKELVEKHRFSRTMLSSCKWSELDFYPIISFSLKYVDFIVQGCAWSRLKANLTQGNEPSIHRMHLNTSTPAMVYFRWVSLCSHLKDFFSLKWHLLQLNDKNHCGKDKIGGKCKLRCEGK